MKATTTKSLGLAFVLAIAALGAACGPPPTATTPEGASSATPAESGAPSVGPAPTPSGEPAAGGTTAPPASSGAPAVAPGPGPAPAGAGTNTPVGPSKYLADVKKIGIDFKKATELEKIGLAEKKKLMPFFVKSLGYEGCNGCHVEGDFKSVTRNMKITREMWKNFVAVLRDDKGGPVFCDSCHQGKNKNLARGDKKALEKFMESDYEHKFTRADKKENSCSTCHGDEMEMKIIEKRWKIAAK